MKELHNEPLMASLEQLSTPQLEDMLRSEVKKDQPEATTVRAIMDILRRREEEPAVETGARMEAAWQDFRRKTEQRSGSFRKQFLKAAAVMVACGLLLAVFTQEVSAGRLWDRIAAWTDSIFELFSREQRGRSTGEYTFRTDNPGLQELYDTVTQLGVTVPVIPMWLDGEYELENCKIEGMPNITKVVASFLCDEKSAVFQINIYDNNIAREYHKNEPDAEPFESNGVIHYIFRNQSVWTVVWTRKNVECYLSIDCRDDVYRVINSIYTSEE